MSGQTYGLDYVGLSDSGIFEARLVSCDHELALVGTTFERNTCSRCHFNDTECESLIVDGKGYAVDHLCKLADKSSDDSGASYYFKPKA